MKWEDTVIHADGCTTNLGIIGATCNCGAEAQAEVSFKAGVNSILTELHSPSNLVQAARQEGMREVVEWVTENEDKLFRGRQITFSKWQAFLKENGIEVNSE